jgi:hypothetical protein
VPSHHEPLLTTLKRNGAIALIAGVILAVRLGALALWPVAVLLMLWPTLGGHWVEVWFLNSLRPRLPTARAVQIAVRLVVWFIGGTGLAFAMQWTAMTLAGLELAHWPWWFGGLAFIALELAVHLVLQLRTLPSFYNGRG